MRIAQLAPLAESVPPKLYGGTERVVAWLVDELVELGHDVTLFASGDSRTRGKLHPVWPKALRLGRKGVDPKCRLRRAAGSDRQTRGRIRRDPLAYRLAATPAAQPARRAVSHDHAWSARPSGTARRRSGVFRGALRRRFPTTSACRFRRRWIDTDPARTALSTCFVHLTIEGSYLAFLGRLTAEKGPEDAIRIARAAGMAAAHRRQNSARRDRLLQEASRASSSTAKGLNSVGEVDEAREAVLPCRCRGTCCFRSTGPSPSVS